MTNNRDKRNEKSDSMSIRVRFAANLRKLSLTKKSFAMVARDLGLNRQQFNNYMTGKNLPNESVIQNICKYFNVDVSILFEANDISHNLSKKDENIDRFCKLLRDTSSKYLNESKKSLPDGAYNLTFGSTYNPDQIIVYTLVIKTVGEVRLFSRLSRLYRDKKDFGGVFRSFHKGFVVFRHGDLYFVSVDVFDENAPSMLIARPAFSSVAHFYGHADIRTSVDRRSVPFVITSIENNVGLFENIKNSNIKDIGDSSVSPKFRDYIKSIKPSF